MEFTQPRLKLRIAVSPFFASSSADYHHRVVGVKRDASGTSCAVILRQFLLLLPIDTTFSDLIPLVKAQYQKLYQSQPGYTKMNKVVLFRDSHQCDLDFDYVVSDICGPNDLIYVMAEMDDSGNKKPKMNTPETKITITPKSSPAKPSGNQNQNSEKKVPEFKPIPVKAPTSKQQHQQQPNPPKTQPKNPQNSPKPIEKPSSETKSLPEAVNPAETKYFVPISIVKPVAVVNAAASVSAEAVTPLVSESIEESTTILIESDIQAIETKAMNTPISELVPASVTNTEIIEKPAVQNDTVSTEQTEMKKPEPVPVKAPRKPRQPKAKPVEVKSEVAKQQEEQPKISAVLKETKCTTLPLEESKINNENQSITSYSEAVEKPIFNPISVITPGPTPTPISTVFIPRKSESKDSSSSEEEDESGAVLKSFDTTNLFGPQVIASEPRRSDAFVLFAAGSTDDDEDSSQEEATFQRPAIVSPLKKTYSSIVSLQAAPSSSEIDRSEDEEEEEEVASIDESQQLPQSVTLRRLSSVSPIPDSSEIPSLSELKESITRIPTPVQILNDNQKMGRPSKRKQTAGGRPSKKELEDQKI